MKYTIQLKVIVELQVEADDVESALDEAAATLQDAEINMDCEYTWDEQWEDVQVYDQSGNLIEEEEA